MYVYIYILYVYLHNYMCISADPSRQQGGARLRKGGVRAVVCTTSYGSNWGVAVAGHRETFNWVLFTFLPRFPKVHNKASQGGQLLAGASSFGSRDIKPLRRVGAISFAFLGRACWASNFHFSPVQKVTLESAVCGWHVFSFFAGFPKVDKWR